ncbi:MAG: SDR family oxidoreductase [Candidatus Thiodiazotropha sp.]
MKKTLIIGATSAIAEATARIFAEAGDALFLVGRSPDKLTIIRDDLMARGAGAVHIKSVDLVDYAKHSKLISTASMELGGLDLVLIAHGTLPEQKSCEQSFSKTKIEFEVNALSTISLLTHLANHFEKMGHGTIAVISSVAGDRGRQSNYVYGAAKSSVSIFLQGLRNRLYRSGVNVLTIKPGFVDTPMTSAFEKGVLWSSPEAIARRIDASITKGKDIVYAPFYWRIIMAVIRLIPEPLFKRMRL